MRRLITKANEHSKKLTIIDTIIYVFLMTAFATIMIIWPHIAEYCVDAMSYATTAFVAVRATYGIKAGLENFAKIKKQITGESSAETNIDSSEEETLG